MKKIMFLHVCICMILYTRSFLNPFDFGDTSIDFVKKKQEIDQKEVKMKLFFDAIKKGNNAYVKKYLRSTEEEEIFRHREALRQIENRNQQKIIEQSFSDKPRIFGPYTFEVEKLNVREYGVWVNEKNLAGFTPIMIAIEYKNNEMLKEFIQKGANVKEVHPVFGKLTLHVACYYENEEAVNMLLEADKNLINTQNEIDGWTALNEAVVKNNVNIVKILLENGADPTITDNMGKTSIDAAIEFGKGEIVKLLRDNVKENRR